MNHIIRVLSMGYSLIAAGYVVSFLDSVGLLATAGRQFSCPYIDPTLLLARGVA